MPHADTPEQILMCRSCEREKCVNCLEYQTSNKCSHDYNRIRELYDLGLNDREISERVGCSANAVFKFRTVNGLAANKRGGLYAPSLVDMRKPNPGGIY